METTTYIKTIKAQDLNQQQQICELLGITEMEYCQNQYNKGLAYAKAQVDGDVFGYAILERSKSFWAYWKNEFAKREAHFLNTFSSYDYEFLLNEYDFIHSAAGIKSSKPVEYLEKEIAYLWHQVWREERSHA